MGKCVIFVVIVVKVLQNIVQDVKGCTIAQGNAKLKIGQSTNLNAKR